jgi:heme/copper-type cytochrome/quinol oxidase subunit 3
MIEHAYEDSLKKHESLDKNKKIDQVVGLSYFISMIIVLFNKFVVPFVVHHIVEGEKWSNKTKLNTSFATKLTLILFTNTALITFSVEIILF